MGQPSHSGPRIRQLAPVGVALEDERPLRGADEEDAALGHLRISSGAWADGARTARVSGRAG